MFKSIIKTKLSKFNWGTEYSLKQVLDTYIVVEFPKCSVLLYHNYRYGTVECEFCNPNILESKNYHFSDVLKFNNIEQRDTTDLFNKSPSKEKLELYATLILTTIYKNLTHVIHGDFTWTKKVDEFEQKTTMIQDTLNTPFIFNHPIYKKLENNDPTWLDDLNSLKKP